MVKATISAKYKLEIINDVNETGNVRETARKYSKYGSNIQPCQIRKWRKQEAALREKLQKNPKALTLHSGPTVQNPNVEQVVYDWIMAQRESEVAVSTTNIIAKACSLDPMFKDGCQKKLRHWVYPFLNRWKLSIRISTRVGQKLSGHLISVRQDFVGQLMQKFTTTGSYSCVQPKMFVNMDESAVYFEAKSSTTVHPTGSNSVPIRCSGSNSRRLTVCVSVASDGTKLPLFLIFKGAPNGKIEKNLSNILPSNVFGCCQSKGWADQRSLDIWLNKIWKPYVSGHSSSVLLLDDFACHKQASFIENINTLGTSVEYIPGGYTCVVQPCDVGVMKSLKGGVRKGYMEWASKNYTNLSDSSKLPYPDRKDIAVWLAQSWSQISEDCIYDTFDHIGLVKGANTPPDTPFPNTPYPFISDDESDSGDRMEVVESN